LMVVSAMFDNGGRELSSPGLCTTQRVIAAGIVCARRCMAACGPSAFSAIRSDDPDLFQLAAPSPRRRLCCRSPLIRPPPWLLPSTSRRPVDGQSVASRQHLIPTSPPNVTAREPQRSAPSSRLYVCNRTCNRAKTGYHSLP